MKKIYYHTGVLRNDSTLLRTETPPLKKQKWQKTKRNCIFYLVWFLKKETIKKIQVMEMLELFSKYYALEIDWWTLCDKHRSEVALLKLLTVKMDTISSKNRERSKSTIHMTTRLTVWDRQGVGEECWGGQGILLENWRGASPKLEDELLLDYSAWWIHRNKSWRWQHQKTSIPNGHWTNWEKSE